MHTLNITVSDTDRFIRNGYTYFVFRGAANYNGPKPADVLEVKGEPLITLFTLSSHGLRKSECAYLAMVRKGDHVQLEYENRDADQPEGKQLTTVYRNVLVRHL